MPPSFNTLAVEIDRCMLRDQWRFRRRLAALRRSSSDNASELHKFVEDVERSSARRARRQSERPRLTYPAELSVVKRKDEITRALLEAQVVVICGETGSGKTTQLPKICLELGRGVAGMIGHTQPRRLAARTLAKRIASELQSDVGGAVGYKIRFSDRVGEATYIKLMTDGILLAETEGDRFLEQYDTLIIDEAHERSINIDFLLGYIKRLLTKRPDLKVIVTSATIDPQRFSRHFDGAPIVEVSGRRYPVEVRYRPLSVASPDGDSDDDPGFSAEDLLERGILQALAELPPDDGDVLVFLPGEQAIRQTAEVLRKAHPPMTEILPLYARLSAGEQGRIFRPRAGRRIVLATNVAETSLTVPGVRYVIDTGLARISRYDTRRKVQRLPIDRISRASAEQRAGRCGRTGPGIAVRLYSEEDFASRPLFTPPEIVRTNLASVILQMAALGLGDVESFPFVDPPQTRAIRDGAATLFELGAIDEEHRLTRIGRELSRLPVDPRVGRIILGGRDHRCLAEILVIAAALSIQDPRERPHDRKEKADQAHRQFRSENSDFVSYLKLWDAFQERAGVLGSSKLKRWCESQFLSFVRMREWQDIHRQLHELTKTMGFASSSAPFDYAALHRALLTGYLGSVAMKTSDGTYIGARNVKMSIFPGSALFRKRPPFIMAAEIVETGRLYARTVAKIDPAWIEPLAEHLLERRYSDPHWDKARGQVVGYEKVTLFGVPIVNRRRIDFARIDAEESRTIFIREALVAGELAGSAAFLRHNAALVSSIHALSQRARRRDLLLDEEAAHAFYDRLLPRDIHSARRFEAWRKKKEATQPRALFLEIGDVLLGDASDITGERFPDALEMGGLRLPLAYRFEPGHADDGVTVSVPLAALGELDPAPFDWLVPGLLLEKTTALLESLPRSIRKHFVPVRETAQRFCAEAHDRSEPLAVALGRYLERMRPGALVPPSAFHPAACAEYLHMRFRVLDETGKLVATSRDLVSLAAELEVRARESFGRAPKGNWERDQVTAWDFGDLPQQVEVPYGAFALPGYPALSAEPSGIALRVVQYPGAARAAHLAGLRRLFAIRLAETVKHVRRHLPGIQAMALQFAMLGSGEALRDDILAAAIDRACLAGEPPRTRDAFETRVASARGRLEALAHEVCARVTPVLAAYHDILRLFPNPAAAPGSSSAERPWSSIREHVARLVYPGFVSATPWDKLPHLERYLQAVVLRIERWQRDPTRDRERAAQIAPYWERYVELADSLAARGVRDDEVERYRWLVEEWRVSLFAQELRTAESVSEKKLDERWTSVTTHLRTRMDVGVFARRSLP